MNKLEVLDKGYVRLVDVLGDDLSVVNAARVSYDKEVAEFSDKDAKLLAFLVREGHMSPFRHAALTFEIYAPLFVARQWWKYAVSSTHIDDQNGWNESSRRYITEDEQFYVPGASEWRSKPENSKQGSGAPISEELGQGYTEKLRRYIEMGTDLYHQAMDDNIAPEIARMFLPAYGMYVRWRWTVSLQGVITFLDQRIPDDAQREIQEYATTVKYLTHRAFPETFKALSK